ncbi:MAG: amidase family protein, partial [Acidobacteriota bacterium]|nr:amidase family protein [Acidobacteriota bacterium]
MLANSSPAPADELFIERLRASGAVLIGKTNTSEFRLAAHTTNRLGNPCANPWNPTRTAGGSSGGAAAACAAGLGPLHHGSDGGGSVRIPAAYCGVVGLKPTGRRVARRVRGAGMSQFEVDGALARTVQDAALLVSVMSGMDDRDPAPYSGDTPDLQRWVVAGALRDVSLS